MGLKSGSRDAGLDEEEGENEVEQSVDESAQRDAEEQATEAASQGDPASADSGTSGRPSMDSIPYKLRRDKVNEGRQQVPYFLRDEVIEAEDDLQDALEAMLEEDVYKSDYREAAMVVAQRNPELVAEVLREWGYDLD